MMYLALSKKNQFQIWNKLSQKLKTSEKPPKIKKITPEGKGL